MGKMEQKRAFETEKHVSKMASYDNYMQVTSWYLSQIFNPIKKVAMASSSSAMLRAVRLCVLDVVAGGQRESRTKHRASIMHSVSPSNLTCPQNKVASKVKKCYSVYPQEPSFIMERGYSYPGAWGNGSETNHGRGDSATGTKRDAGLHLVYASCNARLPPPHSASKPNQT